MRTHFEMGYMVTKFVKRMLRTMEMSIRIERLIQEFWYVENLMKKIKYPVRISAYAI
jgi:hypothetical protein